ncbi:HAMP domain-containing sensor histidine kinase [Pseudoalteromonas sp. BDTF-M6]|uniref:sensor histidine kinase n=1 Tax=Pseudoalteromonas sp. BDTF-M6 TaxID=2796132 RepID=UPI001BAF4F7F|nr:HAMP domain-containing sensor histidine kinase [Pseudoalteromonas sp. BDTF-M6]MBS3797481.1 sensor histidine kinase [Pseudoalteromonas sp. BDTF-M6]
MLHNSLSKKLLTSVLSVYFVLTFVVTCAQIFAEYFNTKSYIRNELQTLQQTFSGSLTRAIWELNTDQSITIAEGLLAIPMVEGIIVRDDSGEVISQLGRSLDIRELYSKQLVQDAAIIEDTPSGLFGYTFPLIFEFSGRETQVGDVTLFSSRDVVVSRIIVSIYLLVGNAMIKTTFLILLFLLAFRKHLTRPLQQLTEQIETVEPDAIEDTRITLDNRDQNELNVMAQAFNNLIAKVVEYRDKLRRTQKELLKSNEKLDQQNIELEQEVARKTSNLSQAMMDLQQQKYELEKQKLSLTEEIELRRQTEQELLTKQREMQRYVDELNVTQERLLGSEKMAALGGLVAGITHDINTPVGIGVTATSFLQERLKELEQAHSKETLTPAELAQFISEAKQSTELLSSNLARASELVASFKQIAVDQASEAVRTINLKAYLGEVIRSLHPKLKHTEHEINIQCPDDLVLNLPAGAISQIFTNLIMNSLIHGFEGVQHGHIDILIRDQDERVLIEYSDDGCGVNAAQLEQLFNPYFTTKRDQGGSGLGTHITFNLVKQTLGGEIAVSSKPNKGLQYFISLPKDLPKPMQMFN